jgi:predicted O-methyltransferase YrrM
MGLRSTIHVLLGPGGREIVRLHRELEGMLSLKESAWLYRAARGRREIVEIGSYRGKSCVIMARGSLAGGGAGAQITAIDPHAVGRDSPRFEFHQKDRAVLLDAVGRHGVGRLVNEMVMTSREALERWDGRAIDLLWVDGDHSYEAARFDLEAWGEFVRPGGVAAAHDYSERFPGVVRAWDEVMTEARGWGRTRRVRSLVWAVRRG